MKFRVSIARSQREYADVIVEAPSVEAAEVYVDALQQSDYDEAYCDMVNTVNWTGGSETFDEDVLDAEEHEDDDEEADVVVPDEWIAAYDLGFSEAVVDGRISDVGRTHPTDADWNEAYDRGRSARIASEGLDDTDKPYTVIVIYWDNHKPCVQHVTATSPEEAQLAFVSPRTGDDDPAYSFLVVLEGHHTAVNDLTRIA